MVDSLLFSVFQPSTMLSIDGPCYNLARDVPAGAAAGISGPRARGRFFFLLMPGVGASSFLSCCYSIERAGYSVWA